MRLHRLIHRLFAATFLFAGAVGCDPSGLIDGVDDAVSPTGDGTRNRPPPSTVPLYTWYSHSRGDHFATTDPRWAGALGDERAPDYALIRHEGAVFAPDRPAPAGTVPLFSWYSPSRGDNFVSTAWVGEIGDQGQPDYELYRVEGYVFAEPVAGTVPLVSWYSPSRGDNFATTSPSWAGARGDRRVPDYGAYRVEGHVFPPEPSAEDAGRFGYGSHAVQGTRPLLVIHQDTRDFPVREDAAYLEEIVFGEVRADHGPTVPLHAWWNPDLTENRVSTDEGWAGQPRARRGEYGFNRLEGHVFRDGQQPAGTIPLFSWYSGERTDNRLSSDPAWAGPIGEVRDPDYTAFRQEGFVFDPARPQPPRTDPLVSWYSAAREEFFTTTHPSWRPQAGSPQLDYEFVRLEGFVPRTGDARTAPLHSWYNPLRADNFTTSAPEWIGVPESQRDGYHYTAAHVQIFDPAAPQPAGTVALQTWTRIAGHQTYTTTNRDNRPAGFELSRLEGYLFDPARPRPAGTVAVYLFHSAARDDFLLTADPRNTPASPPAGYRSLGVQGFAYPNRPAQRFNVLDFFSALSQGQFNWRRAGLVRITFAGGLDAFVASPPDRITQQVEATGFDFAVFDEDRDGVLQNDELGVLVVTTAYGDGLGGQTRGVGRIRLDGGRLADDFVFSFADARGDVNLFAHELFHTVGRGIDIYGPGAGLNGRSSLMASSSSAAHSPGPFRLDPFHAMRTGWGQPPRVVPTGVAGAAVLRPEAPGLLFYDGRRGVQEYIAFEQRHPDGQDYDDGTLPGVAAWTVRVNQAKDLDLFCWPPPGDACDAYVQGPAGPGVAPLWQPADGPFRLQWFDGTDLGLEFQVTVFEQDGAVLTWQPAEGFRPRIDSAEVDGDRLTLWGVFPDRDGLAVVAGGRALPLLEQHVNRVVLQLDGVAGALELVAHFEGKASNPIDFTVR